ncbi:Asp-domain-containing protein [Cantharellus anzutake]|uniref:Asp-domain-containing protein n=1 Tax=Cantharellus anzutake TaxID=1750568 RepID=UPI001904981D|nr:Asp-domain-containing protein [Cantharellus anzutake]KAF8337908.1 Asp-domain-containing protein [Cantharellus anzutake]
MRFTTPLIAASLPFMVLSSPTRIHSNEKGRSIPISRGSTFVNHGVVNITALRAHLAYVGAKYDVGLKNYERSTGPVHPLAWDRATHASKRDISTSALTDVRDSIWYGNISVGNPPVTFAILFDTGSTDFFIPDVSCTNCGALRSARYNPSLSSTSSAVGKSFSLVYGDGSSSVSGYQYIDAVTVAGLTAKRQTLGSATALTHDFRTGATDGLMGLAWPANSEFGATPFFNTLMQQGTVSQGVFAFYFSESGSELRLGGTDESLYSTPLQWIPVTQQRYWRVGLDSINARGTEAVSGLSAIIDSGTALIVGDSSTVREFYRHIPGSKGDVNYEFFTYPCHYDPRISVTFNGASYPIGLNFGPVSNGSSQCLGGIVGLAYTPFWILGDIFMRSVYTAFNFDNASIGFARFKSEWDPKFP